MILPRYSQSVMGLSVFLMLFGSCAYDNEEELFGEASCQPDISYQQTILPILTENCSIPGCHDGSNPLLPDWTVFANVQVAAPQIKERTGDRTMPPSNSGKILSAQQVDDIACWVDSGAQNN
mgnify:CR=1 FL=1